MKCRITCVKVSSIQHNGKIPLMLQLPYIIFVLLDVQHLGLFSSWIIISQWQTSERTLDAPDLIDDFCLNLLDWGCSNVLAIALGSTVYLWDASNGSTSELVTVDDDKGPVTSVNWDPEGCHIAIGLNNSEVQLWDSTSIRQVLFRMMCLWVLFSSHFSSFSFLIFIIALVILLSERCVCGFRFPHFFF